MSNAALNARSDAISNAPEEPAIPESGASAVSWGAIIAGAVVASALSLALLMLGAGIGLVSVSPWSNNNVSVTTFGILAAAWFIAVQLFASGVGLVSVSPWSTPSGLGRARHRVAERQADAVDRLFRPVWRLRRDPRRH